MTIFKTSRAQVVQISIAELAKAVNKFVVLSSYEIV